MSISANNIAYWLRDPLEEKAVRVLGRIACASQGFRDDEFETALLIARQCVTADIEAETLAITEKGEDALRFFHRE